jgi:ribosome production factor 1
MSTITDEIFKGGINPSEIKNKIRRSKMAAKQAAIKNEIKHKIRAKRRQEELTYPEKKEQRLSENVPKTLESLREKDETLVEANDPEVLADEASDEFAQYFVEGQEPKILVTTNKFASKLGFEFAQEIASIFPTAEFVKRKKNYQVKHIVEFSTNRGFTDVLIINEDKKSLNALTHIHLPNGPTAVYKLTSVRSGKTISNHAKLCDYKPELILNNFNTRLGRSIGRMFLCMFPHVPEFEGRQVCTFHNQRDFIFFRRHRYKIAEDGQRADLQEIGPRFTLKLQSLQKGAFDKETGDYEWLRKAKQDGRKKFVL